MNAESERVKNRLESMHVSMHADNKGVENRIESIYVTMIENVL